MKIRLRAFQRRLQILLPVLGLLCVTNIGAQAAVLSASATYTSTPLGGGLFQYDLTLNNTGTSTIGTFWFSWIPGAGFMSVPPGNVNSPMGWVDNITNAYAILWTDTTAALLAPGASQSGFQFTSTLSPTDLQMNFAGPGPGTGDPVTTSFVYIASPLGDPGLQIVAAPAAASTPEASTFGLAILGLGVGLLGGKFRRMQRR